MTWMLFAEADFWGELLKQGWTTMVLAGFAYGVWKVIEWARDNVATPVVKAHLELLNTLREAVPRQHETMLETKGQLERQTCSLSMIEGSTAGMKTDTFEHLALQRVEMTRLEEIRDVNKAQADLMRTHASKIDDHHAWAEKALAGLRQGIKAEIKAEVLDELKDTK